MRGTPWSCTPGVTEAPNAAWEEFGDGRLIETMKAQAILPVSALWKEIIGAVHQCGPSIQYGRTAGRYHPDRCAMHDLVTEGIDSDSVTLVGSYRFPETAFWEIGTGKLLVTIHSYRARHGPLTGKPLVDSPATAFRQPLAIVADHTSKWKEVSQVTLVHRAGKQAR